MQKGLPPVGKTQKALSRSGLVSLCLVRDSSSSSLSFHNTNSPLGVNTFRSARQRRRGESLFFMMDKQSLKHGHEEQNIKQISSGFAVVPHFESTNTAISMAKVISQLANEGIPTTRTETNSTFAFEDHTLNTKKFTIVTQLMKHFEICDNSTNLNNKEALDAVLAVIKNMFPTTIANFKQYSSVEYIFNDSSSKWFLYSPMYKLLNVILKNFPKLPVFNIDFLVLLINYSNSSDQLERRALSELMNAFALSHQEMIPEILQKCFLYLEDVLDDEVVNPMAVSNVLNLLAYIFSITSDYILTPSIAKNVKLFVLPLIKIDDFTIFSIAFTKVMSELITDNKKEFLMPFIDQLNKYWPKSSGKKLAHIAQLIGFLLKKVTYEDFPFVFSKLKTNIIEIFQTDFGPAIEIILTTLDQLATTSFLEQLGELVYTNIFSHVQRFCETTYFNEKITSQASDLFHKYKEGVPNITSIEFNVPHKFENKNNNTKNVWKMIASKSFSKNEKKLLDKKINEIDRIDF